MSQIDEERCLLAEVNICEVETINNVMTFKQNPSTKIKLLNKLSNLIERLSVSGKEDEKIEELSLVIEHLDDLGAAFRDGIRHAKCVLCISDDEDDNASENVLAPVIRFFLVRFLFVFVFFLQVTNVIYLTISDKYFKSHGTISSQNQKALELTVIISTQLLSAFLVLSSAIYMAKLMAKSRLSSSQLAQNYVSTILAFSGIYLALFRNQPGCIEIQGKEDIHSNRLAIFQYIKMLYLSVSSATLCGAANVQPVMWYVTLLVCAQNIINFVYFASILAQTIGNRHKYTNYSRLSRQS